MELSILIARIASLVFLCVGLAGIFNKNIYQRIVNDLFKNAGATMIYGFIELVASFLIVTFHNIWTGWPVIITVVGWMGLIEGAFIIALPKQAKDLSMPVFKKGLGRAMPYVTIALGIVFGYLGFIM